MMMGAISIILHSMMRTKQTCMHFFFKTEDLLERNLIPYLFSNIGYLTFYRLYSSRKDYIKNFLILHLGQAVAKLLTLAFQNKIIHSLQNFSELPCVTCKISAQVLSHKLLFS